MGKLVVVSVEDSDADFYIIEMALLECLPQLLIRRAADGQAAIELLDQLTGSPTEVVPDLVLLDRNLPRRDGFEVLSHLHAKQLTGRIPVFMLTSFATPADRRRASELGARAVITKPTNLDDLLLALKNICDKELIKTSSAKSSS